MERLVDVAGFMRSTPSPLHLRDRAAEVTRDLLEWMLGGRKADALRTLLADGIESFERQGQVYTTEFLIQ